VSKIAHFPQNGTPHSAGELPSNPMPHALDCFGCWLREACRPWRGSVFLSGVPSAEALGYHVAVPLGGT